MPGPAVSIILPNYNYARFIGETLQSVLKQTYRDYETIVVDDGSTDNSVEVIESFVQRDPQRVRLVRKPNGGLASARNAALPHCRGQFITFLDSDDLWHEDFLGTLTSHFNGRSGCMAAYANAEIFQSDSGEAVGDWFGPRSHRTPFSGSCADQLFVHGNFIPIDTAMVRREVFDRIGTFNERFRVGEDWDFWLRVALQFEIDYIDRVLCRIRRHPANLSFRPLNSYNQIRIYRKILRGSPEFAVRIGEEKLNGSWHRAYYELARVLTLQGKSRRARVFFKRSRSFLQGRPGIQFRAYYGLTFFPFIGVVVYFRQWLVRWRNYWNPRAY